ncbi:GNAT family N-acetyltransferase [Methylobacterium sp. SyP6R]|uniref:GNAT family N-acetyltransferase n=1 Tax=Methylobacterium sp. SyP6R TaxID=2718876 RepID=UPI001F18FCBB|nr:GNAT family N-acetyltransferase [Methylobacterium sp. SyP6R]MCF4127853.1 GNAT family N-acetyltransferase [Methylobacterium sp. SyP6R]
MPHAIVTNTERPDLMPVTARWRWEAFAQGQGRSLAEVTAAESEGAAGPGPMPRTFVLLVDDEPVGMASLAAHDLDTRPDLTPWLAGVFVVPHARGRGHAARLVAAVEAYAASLGVATLWLYTRTAEGIYARIGWRTVETVAHRDKMYALMRRDLFA